MLSIRKNIFTEKFALYSTAALLVGFSGTTALLYYADIGEKRDVAVTKTASERPISSEVVSTADGSAAVESPVTTCSHKASTVSCEDRTLTTSYETESKTSSPGGTAEAQPNPSTLAPNVNEATPEAPASEPTQPASSEEVSDSSSGIVSVDLGLISLDLLSPSSLLQVELLEP